jgi:hypothetical protein
LLFFRHPFLDLVEPALLLGIEYRPDFLPGFIPDCAETGREFRAELEQVRALLYENFTDSLLLLLIDTGVASELTNEHLVTPLGGGHSHERGVPPANERESEHES